MEKRTYLTRLAEQEQRVHHRRPCRVMGTIYYVKRGLKGVSFQPCRVLDISEKGCLMQPYMPNSVQSHFYLAIEGIEGKVASAIVGHSNIGFHVEFQSPLPSEVVERLTETAASGAANAGRSAVSRGGSSARAT
jgi:hypothetical protein